VRSPSGVSSSELVWGTLSPVLEGVEMKQRELFSSSIVKDKVLIQAYLARLMRILKGEVK